MPPLATRLLTLRAALVLVVAPPPISAQSPFAVAAPPPAGFDRADAQRMTREHLERLVRLDTQNPPGNEMRTARYFDSVFRSIPGVETNILDVGDGRANFIARVRAQRPTKRPVLLMGHMDVVGADSSKWSTNPFTATERDGYLYGRGTIDDKGMLAAAVTAITRLAARRGALLRDIIFLATAGEEGGPAVGIDRVLERHFAHLRDVEFALNEGGRIRIIGGRIRSVNIQTTEKVSYSVVATARGPSGHGSVPLPANALAALARSVSRVHEWRAPAKLNDITRLYFSRLAEIDTNPDLRDAMRRITAPDASSETTRAAAELLSREPLYNATLRSAQSLTLLNGGIRSNVIPSEGTATFNVRVLPGDDIREFVNEMNRVGAEPSVRYELRGEPRSSPPASPVTTDLFRAMEAAAKSMVPGAVVIPFMSTGATDGAALRAKGIPTYGILPLPLPIEDELRMHGDNERVPIPALAWAAEYLYRVLLGVSGGGR